MSEWGHGNAFFWTLVASKRLRHGLLVITAPAALLVLVIMLGWLGFDELPPWLGGYAFLGAVLFAVGIITTITAAAVHTTVDDVKTDYLGLGQGSEDLHLNDLTDRERAIIKAMRENRM